MRKFRYYSPNWMMWYSEDNYDKLISEIQHLKKIIKYILKGEKDEM